METITLETTVAVAVAVSQDVNLNRVMYSISFSPAATDCIM